MRHCITLLSIISILLSVSCSEDRFIEAEQQMVVEGWIDAGGYPVVILSKTIPASDASVNPNNFQDYIINWGKVTVSDGTQTVVLTGKRSDNYFPPYIYTTNKIRGEVGKTYYLTAEYKDFYATAETTIPPKAKIEEIVVNKKNDEYSINVIINDNPNEKNYYKFFTRIIGLDKCYLSANLAIIDDSEHTFPCSIPINIARSYLSHDKTHALSEKDNLLIKVAQVDSAAYVFWNSYKNLMELGINPFVKYSDESYSNISGGVGYWIGYGATEYLCAPYNHENPIELKK